MGLPFFFLLFRITHLHNYSDSLDNSCQSVLTSLSNFVESKDKIQFVFDLTPTNSTNEITPSSITSTHKSVSQENWRIPFIPSYINSFYDIDNEDWQLTDYIMQNTRSIEPPLRWEYYTVNSNFADISNYYLQIMKEEDFQVTQNRYDNETSKGFITFTSPTLIVYVQFINNFLIDGQDDVIVVYKKMCTREEIAAIGQCILE